MELRARIRPTLRRAALMAATAALLVPVTGTATADAKKAPVVTRVTPKKAFVGETMTIRGRHFRAGVNKNIVAFKRNGQKVVLVPAGRGTSKLLKVELPKRLEKVLLVQNGTPVPTSLQIRVMSSRFGKRYTSVSKSPLVAPERPPAPPKPKEANPRGDCDGDGQINRIDTDDDNDLLSDEVEKRYDLDGCKADTDGDKVEDGYEYQSARDLNDDEHQSANNYIPFPEKRPYPNGLDKTDGGTDHDGDDLTLLEEYQLWKVTIKNGAPRTLAQLGYSAGEQYSINVRAGGTGNRMPTLDAAGYDKQVAFLQWAGSAGYGRPALSDIGGVFADYPDTSLIADYWEPRTTFDIRDMNRDTILAPYEETYYDSDQTGKLSDAERDEDADGLTNWAETRGCMSPVFWSQVYDKETPYYITYQGTRLDDEDTDGDGVRDGADDQDFDDVPNVMECSRVLAAAEEADDPDQERGDPTRPWVGFVNAFNPCLPHIKSRTCKRIVPTNNPWAPFNPEDEYYLIRN
jgi:IPT/TIG domain-containing protein